MRLFVAISLDQTVRAQIIAARKRLLADLGPAAKSLRPVGDDQLHLTLAFVGEVGDRRGVVIAQQFPATIARPRFTLTLGGSGVFPPRGAPRVLWLGVVDGVDDVTALHTLVVQHLTGAGVTVDTRRFSPHLTLGRWRAPGGRRASLDLLRSSFDVGETGIAEPRPEHAELTATSAARPIARVAVNAVTLFESRRSVAGSAYTALAHAHLT